MNCKNRKNGFTLIEVLIAVIFIGLAIAALVGGNSAFTRANAVANEMSTAEFLTEQIREGTALMVYTALPALNNVTYSPPVNAEGSPLSGFAAYSQKIKVEYVNNTDFTQVQGSDENFIRVTVRIYLGARELSSTSWIRAKYTAGT